MCALKFFDVCSDEMTSPDEESEDEQPPILELQICTRDGSELYEDVDGKPLPPAIMKELTHFRRRQDKGFFDVWWLYDSGGK